MAKPKGNPRLLGRRRKEREARAKAFERALMNWMRGFRAYKLRQATDRVQGRLSKQTQDEFFASKLAQALELYGVREFGDSVNAAAGDYILNPKAITAASEGKEITGQEGETIGVGTGIKWFYEYKQGVVQRVNDIMQDTANEVNNEVNEMLTQALSEVPQPSAGAFARRLRGELFQDRFVFSDHRASVIARTELTQAQNLGTFEGYKATGVKRIKWLAFSDGKSGDRHHERMNGKQVNIGEDFKTPLGNSMRFPGDSRAPIKETANCRCTVAAVIGRDEWKHDRG